MRILIVEDESKVARALKQGLEGEYYDVDVAATGEDGFFRASSEQFDLIILDVMLPGRDGFEILTTLRKSGSQGTDPHTDGTRRCGGSRRRA